MSVEDSLVAIDGRLDKLQHRMDRIEKGLNRLLEIFGQPPVESEPQELGNDVHSAGPGYYIDGQTYNIDSYGLDNSDVTTSQDLVHHPKHHEAATTPYFDLDVSNKPTYTPLDVSKNQIRILVLHPSDGDHTAPIIASLHVQSLDDEAYTTTSTFRQYIALSYTWGAPTPTSTIQLDGCDFPVTRSLEKALRAMRNRGNKDHVIAAASSWPHSGNAVTYWWVDQLCINQDDVDERNEQVALMRRIYKRASSVQVWLGEAADDSDVAMDLLHALGATPLRAPGEKALEYPSFDAGEVDRHWRALDAFLQRPWWARVWIRQEVALSSTVMLVCGNKSVYMDVIGPAITAIEYAMSLGYEPDFMKGYSCSTREEGVRIPWTHHASSLTTLRRATNGGYTFVPLTHLLAPSRTCRATDPRDTVFSTLGLCDPEVFLVTANYRMDLKDVLMSAACAVINTENGLDILGACQNVERKNGLPSWVPNLSEPWKAMPFPTLDERSGTHKSELIVTEEMTGVAQVEGDCLILYGGHADAIAVLCADVVPQDATTDHLASIFSLWKEFAARTAKSKTLDETDIYEFVDTENLASQRSWIRFLTVLGDEANDLRDGYGRRQGKEWDKRDGNARGASVREILQTAEEELQDSNFHYHLNFKLIRSYLLPSKPEEFHVWLHPDRRALAGLRRNGPGRKLCVTKRGFLALVPEDARIKDQIALFQGASFPYVLRRHGGKQRHLLVGEAFVPRYTSSIGEQLATEEYGVTMDAEIRLY